MIRRRHLVLQAALGGAALIAMAVFALVRHDDWLLYAAGVPGVLAVVAPLASGWERRIRWESAIGIPATSILLVNACCFFGTIAIYSHNNICDQTPHGCEGVSIFLFMYPFYAAILVIVGIALGLIARLVALGVAKIRQRRVNPPRVELNELSRPS